MDIEQYKRAQAIFDEVVDLPTDTVAAAVGQACGTDAALEALVLELLELDQADSAVDDLDSLLDAAAEAVVPTVASLQAGATIDRYIAEALLGVGGTAQVWRVRHQTLGTLHALKVLTWTEPGLERRMFREARAQAQLQHPHIVPVHDAFEVDGHQAILMPFIDGPALDALLAHHMPTVDEAVGLFRGLLDGVGHAHDHGLIHRDLKPGNVLIDLRGGRCVPRVADFGLVKGTEEHTWTRPGEVLGTLTYAAPEQLVDTSAVDHRADIWSLGALLFHLGTGRRPIEGTTLHAIFDAHRRGIDLSRVPAALKPCVSACLTQAPEQRLQSCAEVAHLLPDAPTLDPRGPLATAARELVGRPWRPRSRTPSLDPTVHRTDPSIA